MTEFTLEELLASINETTTALPEDGFYTAIEWAEIWGVRVEKARASISKLLKAGRMTHGFRLEVSLLDGKPKRKDTFKVCTE